MANHLHRKFFVIGQELRSDGTPNTHGEEYNLLEVGKWVSEGYDGLGIRIYGNKNVLENHSIGLNSVIQQGSWILVFKDLPDGRMSFDFYIIGDTDPCKDIRNHDFSKHVPMRSGVVIHGAEKLRLAFEGKYFGPSLGD